MKNELIFTLQNTWTVVTERSQTTCHMDLVDWNISKQTLPQKCVLLVVVGRMHTQRCALCIISK